MANRRMFSIQIVDSDAFLDLPLSAQCLYFHLNMRADDDGFIGNPNKIMRMIGASNDDMKLLIAKKFLLIFESNIIVIKHWWMHNTLRKDCYHETAYLEEKQVLKLKENNAYTFSADGIPVENTNKKNIKKQSNFSRYESVNGTVTENQNLLNEPLTQINSVKLSKDNINLNTHNINLDNDYVCADSIPDMNYSEPQQNYAKQIFDLYHENGLPCCNGNLFSFMSRDFKFGLENIRRIGLKSSEVIEAVKNYIKVVELQKTNSTWWESKQAFHNFTEKQILNFLPGTFDFEHYKKQETKNEKPIKNKTQYVSDVMSKDPRFKNSVYDNFYDDWVDSGRPIDEAYFEWQAKFEGGN